MKSMDLEYRLSGYSFIEIEGTQVQRFLNICFYRGIDIRNLNIEPTKSTFVVKTEFLSLLKELSIRYHVKIRVTQKRGFPYFYHYYRKRWGFILGAIVCYCFLLYMSNCIWEMEFEGNLFHTDSSLETYLTESGISYGSKMSSFNAEELELNIRRHYSDVAWCSVQKEGCKLTLTITETNLESMEGASEAHINAGISIIADTDAVISSIITQAGEPVVVAGQQVKAGDVLVNGYITYMDDYDYITGYEGVCAQAIIRAVREIHYEQTVSLLRPSTERTLTIYHDIEPINKIFPYLYYKESIVYSVDETDTISYEQAVIKLENKLYEQIKKWEEKGYEVIEKKLKIEDNNREVVHVGTVVLEGPFGIEQPCTIPIISEGLDESDGN